jgi:hypothetical protein
MIEEWKFIKIEGYSISNTGKFRNDKTGKILKTYVGATGYYVVNIKPNGRIGKSYSLKIHRLIAEAFIPNPENNPHINHKDGNKLNNIIENLEWITHHKNVLHAKENNLLKFSDGETNGQSVLTEEEVKYIRKMYIPFDRKYGMRALSRKFNVHHATIERICNNITWNKIK